LRANKEQTIETDRLCKTLFS